MLSLGSHFVFFWVALLRISLGGGEEGTTDKRKENKPTTFFFYTETTSFLHYLGWFPCNSWWPRISNLKLRTWQVSKSWPYFSNKRSVFSKLTHVVFLNSSLLPPNKLPFEIGASRIRIHTFIHNSGTSKDWDPPNQTLSVLLDPQYQRCLEFSVLRQKGFSKTASHTEQLRTKPFLNPGWEIASRFLLLHSIAMAARRLTIKDEPVQLTEPTKTWT